MAKARTLLRIILGIALVATFSVHAKPSFNSSEIESHSPDILYADLYADLDGSGLKSIILIDTNNLSIFHQDAARGFPRQPQQQYTIEERPTILWPARLGHKAASLLLMTSDGVTELVFTNQTDAPLRRQIIHQATVLPDALDEARPVRMPMSANTGGDWPLLLLPASSGLQVWQHQEDWRLAQTITNASTARIEPKLANPGYSRSTTFNFSIGDINGDKRDDLIVRTIDATGMEIYSVYLQQTNGLFGTPPALVYTNKGDPLTWLCWTDLNHDGRVDLIKSKWLEEPSFLPGMPSGKVVAGAYIADANGQIPSEPQSVFRKNDWTPSLPVIDLDGDGLPDVVLGFSTLDKEGVRKQITTKELDLSLKFFFNRGGTFPKVSDFQRDVAIHMDERAMDFDWRRSDSFSRLVNLSGDFNGDGKKDLLVRDHSDHISIYFFNSREKGFSPNADLKFNCPEPIEWMQAEDLNGDGVSDLIVKLHDKNIYRVFVSQGK